MEQNIQPPPQTPPPPPKKNSGILLGILLLILGIIVGLAMGKTTLLSNLRIPYLGATPTPILLPTSTPTPDVTANWKTIDMKGCSTLHANFKYSLKTPNSWTFSKTQDDQYRTKYNFTEGRSRMEINCDTAGVGSVICVNGGELFTYGCYWTSDPNTKGYGAQYDVQNPFGTFVFTVYGVEKSLLTQILSTFKFVDQYTCPANGWVDCMPGTTVKPECSPAAMAWYKTNCPNFKGGAL